MPYRCLAALAAASFATPASGETRFTTETDTTGLRAVPIEQSEPAYPAGAGEDTEQARVQIDETTELGGWNLYESAMLALMSGRLEDQQGNAFGKLAQYSRALAVGAGSAVQGKDRRELLARIFEVEYGAGQYSAALATADELAAEPGSDDDLDALAGRLAEIRAALADDADIVARARLTNACDCPAGEGLWQYPPTRKRFAFAHADPGVRRFEARCDNWRLKGDIDTDTTYVMPAESRNCRVFVFGAAGADFQFVESAGRKDAVAAGFRSPQAPAEDPPLLVAGAGPVLICAEFLGSDTTPCD